VTNESSTAISEVELLDDDRIRGEKENLAPGLDPVSFTVTLGGGTYQLYCPGADTELQDVTVEGEAAPAPTGGVQDVLAEGTTGYAAYVVDQVAAMVQAVGTLVDAVDAGDVEAAKAAYGAARPFYERIESSVEGFVMPGADPTDNAQNLDYLIDMRESNLDDAVGWHGFHAIERDLWQAGAITDQTKAYAAELATNVQTLNDEVVPKLTYLPEDLANGAAGLIEEVETNKITGEEELYSHLDLVDFAGNLEGARQAFANLKPGLEQIDADLTDQVSAQFDAVQQLIDGYRDAGAVGGYAAWTDELRTADQAKLTAAIQALHEPLSQIAEKVATAA
jgi:iron uptake system component EfeO